VVTSVSVVTLFAFVTVVTLVAIVPVITMLVSATVVRLAAYILGRCGYANAPYVFLRADISYITVCIIYCSAFLTRRSR
jgi:hypothetical protein